MKRVLSRASLVLLSCIVLSACATSGTRVTSNSDTYKQMAKTQQTWCTQFGCGCTLDGAQATCSLVSACLNSGSCQRASQ